MVYCIKNVDNLTLISVVLNCVLGWFYQHFDIEHMVEWNEVVPNCTLKNCFLQNIRGTKRRMRILKIKLMQTFCCTIHHNISQPRSQWFSL